MKLASFLSTLALALGGIAAPLDERDISIVIEQPAALHHGGRAGDHDGADAPVGIMRNCRDGWKYCGQTLLNIGNYQDEMYTAWRKGGPRSVPNPTIGQLQNSLFKCGYGGEITFLYICAPRYCKDNGVFGDDECKSL